MVRDLQGGGAPMTAPWRGSAAISDHDWQHMAPCSPEHGRLPPRAAAGSWRRLGAGWPRGCHRADQPPSDGSTTPLMLAESSLASQQIAAASCSGCAVGGRTARITGPIRSAATRDLHGASMLVATGPGATALQRTPLGP